nr:outer membrane lipoprotein-sorting protein [Haliscomenobacter sp.]
MDGHRLHQRRPGQEASVLEDYDHSILGDTLIEERSCYKIQLLPKPAAAVVWGKVIMCIDKKDFLMLHVTYFDEDGHWSIRCIVAT